MIIKAFLNAAGVNSLLTGGTAVGSSRPDSQSGMYIETLIDTHEYSVSPGDDPTVGMSYFTFGPRPPRQVSEAKYLAQDTAKPQQEAKPVVSPTYPRKEVTTP
jgi:hypothetical protein